MALRKNPSIGNGHRSDLVFAYYITGHGFGHATRVVDVSFRLLSFAAAFARAPTYTPPFPLNPFCLRVVDVTFRFLPFAASFARVRRTRPPSLQTLLPPFLSSLVPICTNPEPMRCLGACAVT
ncbi:hypothetical protein OPV22_023582 [Ensete ventricosum]|uniref:Uncharacterized protein n=1 Tax=Ensete ventricosum TaxID=4639 RepID=A0AAV8PCY7_ENSVE|nr:hypothetical protein OPV22_023582 [Ensete ventricosum]